MRGLDKDCDSTIDLQEFASRFEAVFTRLNAKQDVRSEITSQYITAAQRCAAVVCESCVGRAVAWKGVAIE